MPILMTYNDIIFTGFRGSDGPPGKLGLPGVQGPKGYKGNDDLWCILNSEDRSHYSKC